MQIFEATGRNPTFQEFAGNFKHRSMVLHKDEVEAWSIYERTIEAALKLHINQTQSRQASIISQIHPPIEESEIPTLPQKIQYNQPTPSQFEPKKVQLLNKTDTKNAPTIERAKSEKTTKSKSWLDWLLNRK